MISTSGASPVRSLHRPRRARDRADLHLVDLRVHQPEPAAARAEHRVRLLQRADAGAHALVGRLLLGAAGTRAAAGRAAGSSPAARPSPRRCPRSRTAGTAAAGRARRGGSASVVGQDHLLHDRQPLVAEEHVLGAAEADPLGAELAGAGGVLRRVGVRAHARGGARSSAQPSTVSKSSFSCGGDERHRADEHLAGAAVDRDQVALAQLVPADRARRPSVERERRRSRRRTACPSRARRRRRARSCRRAR